MVDIDMKQENDWALHGDLNQLEILGSFENPVFGKCPDIDVEGSSEYGVIIHNEYFTKGVLNRPEKTRDFRDTGVGVNFMAYSPIDNKNLIVVTGTIKQKFDSMAGRVLK